MTRKNPIKQKNAKAKTFQYKEHHQRLRQKRKDKMIDLDMKKNLSRITNKVDASEENELLEEEVTLQE